MKINCTYTDLVELHKITPNPKNNNRHNSEQIERLAKIIDFQGQRRPLIISKTSGFLNCGHCTLEAIKFLGWEKCAVDYQEFESAAVEYANMTADNELARWAELDRHMMLNEIESGDLGELDLDLLGLEEMVLPEVEECPDGEEDSVPEIQPDPITKKGDVWLLGNHRVMCGDSTMIDEVEKLMAGSLADQLITDPPYNVAYVGKTKDAMTIQNDKMEDGNFRQFLSDAFTCADTVMKEGAVFYIWHADSEGYNFRGACFDSGWQVRQCLIWKKQTLVMGRQDYHWKHEPCLYGWKSGAGHLWSSDRKQTTILEFDRPSKSDLHPTMKPVELMEYQILNNTKGKDIVLDLFLGSGSTLIASDKTRRRCFGMELDEKYCDVIVKRWQEYTKKEATLEGTGETFNALQENRV